MMNLKSYASSILLILSRNVSYKMKSKHYNPRFRTARSKKYLKINLIDTDQLYSRLKLTPEEIRSKMKNEGLLTHRPYMEKNITLTSSLGVLDPYVPLEDEGISSQLKDKIKDQSKEILLKGRSMLDVQKIKKMDLSFKMKNFPIFAQDIYMAAHKALCDFDEKRLHEFVTEKAFIEMTHGLEYCTILWEFLESIEPPRVVHVRAFNNDALKGKGGPAEFAQITVRFHTKQRLSIYDRFGRLMYGNKPPLYIQPAHTNDMLPGLSLEMPRKNLDSMYSNNASTPRDVLEYVVFENQLINIYGKWRIHAKIIPSWLTKRHDDNVGQVIRTFDKSIIINDKSIVDSSNDSSEKKEATTCPATTDRKANNLELQNKGISKIQNPERTKLNDISKSMDDEKKIN